MAELAADAVGPKKTGENCGIAFVYRGFPVGWHAEYKPLAKDTDATALELAAVAMGMAYLASLSFQHMAALDSEIRIYSDTARLFEYLDGTAKVVERHQGLMDRINYHASTMKLNGHAPVFEQVMKSKREGYPLYLMADALSRHARTLSL